MTRKCEDYKDSYVEVIIEKIYVGHKNHLRHSPTKIPSGKKEMRVNGRRVMDAQEAEFIMECHETHPGLFVMEYK